MIYRTKTYVAGAWEEDYDAIMQLYKWKESNRWVLDFVDAHDYKQARDSSNPCNIKRSLQDRLDHSKTFVLVVGPKTRTVRKGECSYCSHYGYGWCHIGGTVSHDSYIDYECKKAIRDGLKIIVLYNSVYVHKDWCPDCIKNCCDAEHISMKKNSDEWDYFSVKHALLS